MPDTLKKALLGAVVGALLVVFYTHVSDERAKRDPAAQAGRPGGHIFDSQVRPFQHRSPHA